MARAQA
jgi:hypothetical protein